MAIQPETIFDTVLPAVLSDPARRDLGLPERGQPDEETIRFDIVAEDETTSWTIDLSDGTVSPGSTTDATTVVTIDRDAFSDVWTRRLHPRRALSSGKVRVRGKMRLAAGFQKFLGITDTP